MRGRRLLGRMYAKHRAAKYAGKTKYGSKAKKKTQMYGLLFLLAGLGVLYGMKLPLLRLPGTGAITITKLVEAENRSVREENVLPVQYVNEPGRYLPVSHAEGEIPKYISPKKEAETIPVAVKSILEDRFGLLDQVSFQSFFSNYYIEDPSTKATEDLFHPGVLADYDLKMEKKQEPQILIFHTHGSEGYADSRAGVTEDTVIGAGEILAKELQETYGYQVIHEKTVFDRKADGTDDRNNAYNNALPVIEAILEKYPAIEVVIDLHRDSGEARTSVINGVSTAKVMLFNGLCRTKDGPISYYNNPNLQGNLAFSLHLQITGNELYPGLMHRIYLKSYRYNMHLKEKYLLVELGTHKNTVAEAKAAMIPFAETIATVLSGEY